MPVVAIPLANIVDGIVPYNSSDIEPHSETRNLSQNLNIVDHLSNCGHDHILSNMRILHNLHGNREHQFLYFR